MRASVLPSHVGENTPLRPGRVNIEYTAINSSQDYEVVMSAQKPSTPHGMRISLFILGSAALVVLTGLNFYRTNTTIPLERAAWSSVSAPFSTVDPAKLGIYVLDRPEVSKPGVIFAGLGKNIPLPTNSWYENLFLGGQSNTLAENSVFQVPYILDTSGFIQGIRTHPCHVQANDRTVMVRTYNCFMLVCML